jgi:ABC-type glycerol-3-phosphate transport system permease component
MTAALRRLTGSALLIAFLFCWTVPVLWGAVTSFKNDRDVLNYPPISPFHPTLSNYVNVMSGDGSIVPNLQSSAILSVATTMITIVLAIPAAYALARLRMPAKKPLGFYVLATQMLPPIGLVIPYFLMFSRLGLLNTYSGLILVYISFSLPFAIWLMVSYFEEIPREMEEAALIDRASRLKALWHVILPQVRGGISVTVVFVFLNAWNEFLFAVVLGGRNVRPVTVGMFNFISLEQTQWGRVSAAALIAMAPVILLGLLAQRHIVKGLTLGAVKGTGRQ